MNPGLASSGDTLRAFTTAADQLFENLAQLKYGSLLIALGLFGLYLLARSRATLNALRAAYPGQQVSWRKIWGAYVAAYGLNGVVPAGGGSIVQLVLSRNAIRGSSYSTVTSALCVGGLFDGLMAALVLAFAFTQGVFPKPKDFGGLESFDISFFARHVPLTLFLVTGVLVAVIAFVGVFSRRHPSFWADLRQGFAILSDRRRYVIGMCLPQLAGWTLRVASYYYLLDAFHVGASVPNAILVIAAQLIAAIVPFTPGGAGVQQALLLVIFASTAPTDSVAVFSVGQQIAITTFTLAQGFAAIFFVFKYRSFRAVLRDSKAQK
ncbi:MAG: lysylphosphatidylglycerol synthase transmembrane domain-containing protein, partial [Solirubrobacteraceae bacterium]